MAKQAKGLVRISGKLGHDVFVDNKEYGYQIRKAPIKCNPNSIHALKPQYNRTIFLNKLASELNTLMKDYFGIFKSADFYHRVHKCFRREPLNNRFLLLLQLKGLELYPAYPMNKLGGYTLSTKEKKRMMAVQLTATAHPPKGIYEASCYAYELLLLCWDKDGHLITADWQLSEWIPLGGGLPQFDFSFAYPKGTSHWLLCLRQQLGVDEQDIDYFAAKAVQIVEVGSFNAKDKAILKERALAVTTPSKPKQVVKRAPEMGRVKGVVKN